MNKRLFILLLLILFTGQINSQEKKPELDVYLDSLLPKYFNYKSDGPGVAVAVSLNGELLASKAFGMANLEHKSPISRETKFHLISGCKQFTAYAILKLEQQNLLSLDDEINQYLPKLPDFGHPITIKQLLTHTSGIRQETHLERIIGYWNRQVMTQSRALELIYSQKELNFEPGTKFNYSNSGYTLLAEIIKNVTGEPFENWMDDHVFGPLGMNNTIISSDYSKIIVQRASAYDDNRYGFIKASGDLWHFYGGTGVYSTTSDLMRWLKYLDEPSDADKSIIARMEEQATLTNNEKITWGLGLKVHKDNKGRKRIWHTGDNHGYHCWIGRYPNEGISVVILSNLDSFKPEYLVEDIANYLLPETNSVYDDSKPEVEKYEGKLTPVRASTGWYKTNPLPVHYTSDYWRMTQSDNDLYFHPSSREEIKLIKDSDTDFKLENTPLSITFHRNMQNNEFLLSVNGPEGPMYAEKISNDTFHFDINSSTEVEGVYYSPELNVEYEVFIEDSKLKVRHHSPFVNRRWDPFVLHPLKKDSFISERSFFQIVEFIRDSNDKIIGLKVTTRGQRVENLWFEKTN